MNWLLLEGRSESGPYNLEQLRQLASTGKLFPESELRDASNKRVVRGHQIMGLFPEHSDSSGSGPVFQQAPGLNVKSQSSLVQAPSQRAADHINRRGPNSKSRASSFALAALLLAGLGLGGVLFARKYLTTPPSADRLQTPVNQKLQELELRISRWKNEQAKVEQVLASLQEDRNGLLWQFNRLGYDSPDKANGTPRGQTLLQELRSLTEQVMRLKKKQEEYSLAIFQSESKLRTIDRSLKASQVLENEDDIAELFTAVSAADSALAAQIGASPEVEVEQELNTLLADLQDDQNRAATQEATVILLDLLPRDLSVSCLEQPGIKIEGVGRYRRVQVPDALLNRELHFDFAHPQYKPTQSSITLTKGDQTPLTVELTAAKTK